MKLKGTNDILGILIVILLIVVVLVSLYLLAIFFMENPLIFAGAIMTIAILEVIISWFRKKINKLKETDNSNEQY